MKKDELVKSQKLGDSLAEFSQGMTKMKRNAADGLFTNSSRNERQKKL
jgi:hypothetical protein